MTRVGVFVLLMGLAAPAAWAQADGPRARELAVLPDLVSNEVRVLAPAGDSLWSGPLLTLYLEPEDRPRPAARLLVADEPALTEEENLVFTIAARNVASRRAAVWAGLAFDTGGGEPGAGGFLVSSDGGASFDRRAPQLDAPADTTVRYGVSTLPAVPVTQQAGSAPQDLALGPAADTAWVAGLRSGVRWSADGGQTWTRAALPPDTSRTVDPATETAFLVAPPVGDGQGWANHVGYSVLVDETGTVWAGTLAGVNRSRPGSVTATGRRAWRRFAATDTARSLPGNAVVALAEQPRGGRNPIWMATWASQERGPRLQRFGVAVTPNGGQTFRQTLIGERIYDLAARPTQVYAAGESGLFVTTDQGRTWRSVERFPLQDVNEVLPSTLTVRAVATTETALWVGTTEGLLRLDRDQEARLPRENPEWELFRAKTPVNPEQPSEQVPDVATYAYPNPFVPSRDELVRIVYELDEPRSVTVNIYDFGMNRVRTITEQQPAGQQETVWRGRDEQGLRVPTGTYIYTVDLGGRTVDGKIVVAN